MHLVDDLHISTAEGEQGITAFRAEWGEWFKCPFEHFHICLQEGEWSTQFMRGVGHKLLLMFICPLDRDQSTHGKKTSCNARESYAQSADLQLHQQQDLQLALTSCHCDI